MDTNKLIKKIREEINKLHLANQFLLGILVIIIAIAAIATIFVPGKKAYSIKSSQIQQVTPNQLSGQVRLASGIERKVFIHYRQNVAARVRTKSRIASCSKIFGKDIKWKTLPIPYVVDPDNNNGLAEEFITGVLMSSFGEWDFNTSASLLGARSVDYSADFDTDAPDGRNELLFGNYSDSNVIAITVIWGIFSGSPSQRKISEFDILFDTDFTWGDATSDASKMDLQNIATHELGHGLGIDDLYDSNCSELTMYGYSLIGETKKRTLENGDIKGVQKLYGE